VFVVTKYVSCIGSIGDFHSSIYTSGQPPGSWKPKRSKESFLRDHRNHVYVKWTYSTAYQLMLIHIASSQRTLLYLPSVHWYSVYCCSGRCKTLHWKDIHRGRVSLLYLT